jgi:hypothetical protein
MAALFTFPQAFRLFVIPLHLEEKTLVNIFPCHATAVRLG